MGSSFKSLGKGEAQALFARLRSPFAGLSVGILATVLVQSSSVTTSIIVGLVGNAVMPIEVAVFAVMGCNIGTTVTNTLVSLGHARHDAEFRRAFAGATMHDFFNVLAIAVFFPLEYATGFLRHTAEAATGLLEGGFEGASFKSPVKVVVSAIADPIKALFFEDIGLGSSWGGGILIALSLVGIFAFLITITKLMRGLMADRLENSLNAVLGKSGVLGIFIGLLLTVAVQSSSITTSLMIPLFAAGILKLENGFPVTVGANIGTTVTGLIASSATASISGLTIALVHLFFNVAATILLYPIPAMRRLPVRCAEKLAELTSRTKIYAVLYVLIFFVLIPLLGTLLIR